MKVSFWFLLSFHVTAVTCFSRLSFTLVRPSKTLFHTKRPTKYVGHAVLAGAFATTQTRPKQDRQSIDTQATDTTSASSNEIILTMFNGRYNLTSWADHHPGGIAVLRKFNHRNATQAYEKIGHSPQALALLESFRIVEEDEDGLGETLAHSAPASSSAKPSWRASTLSKLITKEDPFHVHKILGIFCLLHFIYRYTLAFSGRDVSAGFGNLGRATASPRLAKTAAFLLPHALLSSSSLLFHTVPLERVRGKPMIWKEYRWHNMVFAFRSIVACFLATLMIKINSVTPAGQHQARVAIVAASSIACLTTHALADVATARLRTNATETTITTVPFWEGCTPAMHNGLRAYYGYSQFAATMSCLIVCRYPSWSFICLFPIQLASLLMTLCRKGIITSRQFHYGYTLSLLSVLTLVIQNTILDPRALSDLAAVVGGAAVLYGLRRKYRLNKYALWIPTAIGRVMVAASH